MKKVIEQYTDVKDISLPIVDVNGKMILNAKIDDINNALNSRTSAKKVYKKR